MKTLPSDAELYRALCERDPSYDGLFVVGVKTTGIFCRPVCPARKPLAENVSFYPSVRDALCDGFRPCRRCRPTDVHARPPAWIARLNDAIARDKRRRFTDADLKQLSIEPSRVRRHFKEHYGMTFQAYQRSRRLGLALADVRRGADIDDVGYQHGFESASGFREAFERAFGCTPGRGRTLAPLLARWIDTPLGAMLAVAKDAGLCLLEFVDRKALASQIAGLGRSRSSPGGPATVVPGEHPHLDSIEAELGRYFAGELTRFETQLCFVGTPFQRSVWKELLRIPHGSTISYSALADNLGRPGSQRAVANANGQNRLGIVVPCHRVIGADGALRGYGGGVWRKRWLIELESGAR